MGLVGSAWIPSGFPRVPLGGFPGLCGALWKGFGPLGLSDVLRGHGGSRLGTWESSLGRGAGGLGPWGLGLGFRRCWAGSGGRLAAAFVAAGCAIWPAGLARPAWAACRACARGFCGFRPPRRTLAKTLKTIRNFFGTPFERWKILGTRLELFLNF